MMKIALNFLKQYGFSVIPLKPDKRPLIKWEEYQKRLPTEEEIRTWWSKYPTANIGIVTGKLSGIAVIDIDYTDAKMDEVLPLDYAIAPCIKTPRGYHYYFKYKDGITNTVNINGQKMDVRGEGGYVVAPPSVNEKGERYKWIRSPSTGFPEFPMEILSNIGQGYNEPSARNYLPLVENKNVVSCDTQETFIEGRRDEDLFHAAHLLIKAQASESFAKDVLMRLARTCDPPFPEGESLIKVDSAVKRAVRKERPLAKEVDEWVRASSGWFNIKQIGGDLGIYDREEKKNVSQILIRLVKRDILEKHPSKHGWFRLVERECEPIDWQNAPTNDLPLVFPLDLHELVRIYPGNIIIIAGEPNAGKTAFLLNFIYLNMDSHAIHYFNSEMGSTELKIRLGLFKEVQDWNFTAWERSDNFVDIIRPDCINIIDYLEEDEDWKVRSSISSISKKLEKGIAIIALQKQFGTDSGYGGTPTRFRARLYLSISGGQAKIVKAKNWRGNDNPNGKIREFKLYKGSQFDPLLKYWSRPE